MAAGESFTVGSSRRGRGGESGEQAGAARAESLEERLIKLLQAFALSHLGDEAVPRDTVDAELGKLAHDLAQHPAQWRAWHEARQSRESPDLARAFADSFVHAIHERNQFVTVTTEIQRMLHERFSELLARLRAAVNPAGDEVDEAGVRAALETLLGDVASLVDRLVETNLDPRFVIGQATCSEYSPEVQLEVLGLSLDTLLDPILDLGCGPGARLVRYLRDQGREATGLDRAVDEGEWTTRGDWLRHPLGADRWGTVVSHMALTTHFLHHHLRPDGEPEAYARRYMEVLGALRSGGAFVYAPGVPFIEELLPRHAYDVLTMPVASLADTEVDQALRLHFGASVLHACRVTRLA